MFSGDTGIRNLELGLIIYVKSRILEIDNVFVNEMTRENILPGFYDYWTEKSPKGRKMRFEKQTVWEIGKRLGTWSSRE